MEFFLRRFMPAPDNIFVILNKGSQLFFISLRYFRTFHSIRSHYNKYIFKASYHER